MPGRRNFTIECHAKSVALHISSLASDDGWWICLLTLPVPHQPIAQCLPQKRRAGETDGNAASPRRTLLIPIAAPASIPTWLLPCTWEVICNLQGQTLSTGELPVSTFWFIYLAWYFLSGSGRDLLLPEHCCTLDPCLAPPSLSSSDIPSPIPAGLFE